MPAFFTRTMLVVCGLLLVAAVRADNGAPANPSAATEEVASPRIVMYATDWCPYCARARAYFKKNGIDYTEYDIEKSESARAEHRRLGGRGVPLIMIGEQRISGFSEARFEATYGNPRR